MPSDRNRRDLEEVPEEVHQTTGIEWISDVDEVLKKAMAVTAKPQKNKTK